MRNPVHPTRTVHLLTRMGRIGATWAGLGLMVLMLWLGQAGSSQARLDAYYVVRGAAFGTVSPRVLFVLDTSGSMSRRASAGAGRCRWSRCESPDFYDTTEESRISAARRAIRTVVDGAGESAQFSLMTFVQNVAETQAPPPMCETYGDPAVPTRFVWTNVFNDWSGTLWWILRTEGGPNDYAGGLRLCQGDARRPYAYIRWDELGTGSVIGGNNEAGPVPDSPLISLAEADYSDISTLQRRVQFFPTFMGVRAQLNAVTDPDQDILNGSVGDYDRTTEVWNQDFYYWPYVDGFSGYATLNVFDLDVDNGLVSGYDGSVRAGVAGDNDWVAGVELHAPFFVDLSDALPAIPADDWGPADEAQALALAQGRTGPLIEGGVDATGGTPWRSAVGIEPGTPENPTPVVRENDVGSHPSIASYLAFLNTVAESSACAPTNVVLLTDGNPSGGEGGAGLYANLAALRNDLGASVYVVGFFVDGGELNNMACAAAGACDGASCGSPCDDDSAQDWDTCSDPDNPGTACAFVASSTAQLEAIFAGIIDDALDVNVDSGQGSVVNEFGATGLADGVVAVQTVFSASTDYPGWTGHVERRYCEIYDEFDVLVPTCQPPSPEFEPDLEAAFETFGAGCDMGRDWDAGECLRDTTWSDRRIYSHDASNNVYRISNVDGSASGQFISELTTLGHISGPDADDDADDIVAFLLGRDAPGDWKLPGVSNSSPITVRRVPEYDETRLPEVAITDPHCAGRTFGELDAGSLPNSLEQFALDSWDEDEAPNYAYQEAVVVGDDYGIIHAFQLDSGNELFGLIPRFALGNAVAQSANGPLNMGQPADDLENHEFGVSSTLNHGWAFDSDESRWRHLGIIGMGAGGTEYIALDLSHMNPLLGLPVEVLWTTEDTELAGEDLATAYEPILGETWARPALTYHVTNEQLASEPETFLVAGSGYPEDGDLGDEGRVLFVANAMTGELLEQATLPAEGDVYEDVFGAVVDPSVGSHCMSRYWAEGQEAYIADPAGRLFRWDLGRDVEPLSFKHDDDSGDDPWGTDAEELVSFPACTGTGDTCTVSPANPGDPFLFGPSVSAFNRIDDISGGALDPVEENDQFLIALVSGSPNEDTLDGGDEENDFHSSLYLLVDDHGPTSTSDDGISVPAGAPKSGPSFSAGDSVNGNPGYMRIAVSDITRTRTVTPFPGAGEFTETRAFSKAARPVRAPRIYVTGVVDDSGGEPVVVEDVEVYYVTYYIYEPSSGECDPRFYNTATRTWYPDRGTTYELTFRLTADANNGFEFNSGVSGGDALADFGAGFETGLQLVSVEQGNDGECESGNCGASVTPQPFVPCDNNPPEDEPAPISTYVIPMGNKTLDAFSPVEN
ncbi:MAG: type IV pilin biogenesis protein [Nannocystales bacterium]